MLRDALETVISGVAVFAVGYLLWPPGRVYWVAVSEAVGSFVTLVAILGICLGFGYAVRRFTPIAPVHFATGGVIAYLVAMYSIESTVETDSPVHFYWYGLMLGCTILGHAAREALGSSAEGFRATLEELTRR